MRVQRDIAIDAPPDRIWELACALLDRGFGKPREASVSQFSDPEDSPFEWLGGLR